jgi:catechol 2,3-dioxygenase-like lactoylglutathione lyase family enzyme
MDILEIEIQTDDLLETESFYSNILELKLASKGQNSISFLAGQSILTFIKSNKLKPNYHFAFNIPNNKLDEAIIWATSKLNLIENADNGIVANFESWNAKSIYFYDNNKNILEFIARFDLNNATKKPFDTSSIQSISEIGIVDDSPIKLADELVEENNLYFFVKGAQSEKFATLGNDNGLFIIVEANRNWYPTEQQAKKHYTKIKIKTGGLIREITINEENASR